jgi:cytochrome c peroxidase
MKATNKRRLGWILLGALVFLFAGTPVVHAQRTLNDAALWALAPAPLWTVPIPEPANLNEYVRDRQAAIVLGKALFWDMRVGSDGQACASCHFHAGADSRAKNQISTGFLGGDFTFSETPTGGGGPNFTLRHGDFPFPATGGAGGLGLNDKVSSQGVFRADFVAVVPGEAADLCTPVPNDFWSVNGINVRRVEPRNTPTVINAVFNHRNFWDGRANNIFNGVNPVGLRGNEDPNAGVWRVNDVGVVEKVQVAIENSSLASQAVGPPLSEFEMSCAGRTFPDLGRKMLQLRPLALQRVSEDDSVLGPFRHKSGVGLRGKYEKMVRRAFDSRWWQFEGLVDGTYTQMEANFSMFFGLAIQMYEATLVSDRTRFDLFAGGQNGALTEQEKLGLEVFLTKGRCINCHVGPEFTGASARLRGSGIFESEAIERMRMGDGGTAVYDGGFYNVGVRPTAEDLGVGADLAGFPLSFSRQEVNGPKIDVFDVNNFLFEVPGPIVPGERVAVDGSFKVPTVRNVELTAPYFVGGGHATLDQVVEFYDRGGDFPDLNRENLAPDISPIGFTPEEEEALIAFMKALTDPRVDHELAPFDHPQLFVPDGHPGDEISVVSEDGINAVDDFKTIPVVGRRGRPARGLPPLNQVGFESHLAP